MLLGEAARYAAVDSILHDNIDVKTVSVSQIQERSIVTWSKSTL